MKKSTNPSAIRSRKVITDSLFALLDSHPYEEITVTQIIQNSDVARRTFYRNYSSKDDVIIAFLKDVIKEYAQEWEDRKFESIDLIFDFVDRYIELLTLLARNNMLHILLTCLNDYLPKAHEDAASGENIYQPFFGELDPTYLLPFHIGGVWNTIFVWINSGMKEPADDIREILKAHYALWFQKT